MANNNNNNNKNQENIKLRGNLIKIYSIIRKRRGIFNYSNRNLCSLKWYVNTAKQLKFKINFLIKIQTIQIFSLIQKIQM
jgi:hypothetical protein